MSIFVDPTGHDNFGVGICARCSRKFPLDELKSDPNYPELMVCRDDRDEYDPYRLPARQTEEIHLPFVRPDRELTVEGDAFLYGYFIRTERVDQIISTEGGEYLAIESYDEEVPW